MDWKLELVTVPVSDVDRAKAFYVDQVGFNADHDHTVSEDLRFVQLTPPGSACSISIGTGLTEAEPGSLKALQLVVEDIEAAHAAPEGQRRRGHRDRRHAVGLVRVLPRSRRQRLGRAADPAAQRLGTHARALRVVERLARPRARRPTRRRSPPRPRCPAPRARRQVRVGDRRAHRVAEAAARHAPEHLAVDPHGLVGERDGARVVQHEAAEPRRVAVVAGAEQRLAADELALCRA